MSALLEVTELHAGYAGKEVLRGISMEVAPGELVALFGPNGAGKSTLLKTIFGLVTASAGEVWFGGRNVTGWASPARVREGLVFVPQGGRVYPHLSIRENLEVAATGLASAQRAQRVAEALAELDDLGGRAHLPAGTLSGGERQALALARASLRRPSIMLVDEPSLGLSPRGVAAAMDRLRATCVGTGAALLVVEQNVRALEAVADRAYVLRLGEVVLSGHGPLDQDQLTASFLG